MTNTQTLNSNIRDEVARVSLCYGFSSESHISLINESENKIFLIDDPHNEAKFVARVNSGRLVYHTQNMIESEMAWMQAIFRDTSIKVPEVLSDENARCVHQLDLPNADTTRYMSIYSFLPGCELPELDIMSGFKRLGALTAQLHQHSENWDVPKDFDRPHWSAENILDDRYGWGHWKDGIGINHDVTRLLIRAEKTIQSRIGELTQDRSNYGLIHADLRLANVLVDGDTSSIIDFDDSGFGWFLYDLAAALSFLEERSDLTQLIGSWLSGYQRHLTIQKEFIDCIPFFVMLRRLKLMGWVGYQSRNLKYARDIGPQFTVDTCVLANNFLKNN